MAPAWRWTTFRGGLLGYAVATVAGMALTYNLNISAGTFDEVRSLELFVALGTVGMHLGALVAVRRDCEAGHRVARTAVSGWVHLVLLGVVVAGSITLTVGAGALYARVRPHQTQRGPGWFHDRCGNVVCRAGNVVSGEW
jgi:hypothetical protein